MVGSVPNQAESTGFQGQDHFHDLEQKRDREGSVHTTHTTRSQSWVGSRVSHEKNAKDIQLEIDHLKRKLRHERRRRTPSIFYFSFDSEKDGSYRHRSRTLPSKSFSYDENYHHERRNESSSSKGLGNDAMSRALNQISRSPFTRRIEGGRLPRRFNQLTFTMYNSRTDPMEYVSHFNQRMVVHSKNEILMYKVFPSSLGPVAMRWLMVWVQVLLAPPRSSLKHLGLVLLWVVGFLGPQILYCPCPCENVRP